MSGSKPDPNDDVARLAAEGIAHGDATGWFDRLYRAAEGDHTRVPWADLAPNRWLVEWLERERVRGEGASAVVVGCGLGDDAQELARRGYDVTAFDISSTAVDWAIRRFPESGVEYRVADLFSLPALMEGEFDFVFEAYTIQALPIEIRPSAVDAVASLVAHGGSLLAVMRGRENDQEVPGPPWPLSRADLTGFLHAGLLEDSFEDFMDGEIRRFRVHYLRPTS